MKNRRGFLKFGAAGAGIGFIKPSIFQSLVPPKANKSGIVLSTWPFGMIANEGAWNIIGPGGNALDAVEAGVKVSEADPESTSVGLSAYPDREGKVTLDASIMDSKGQAGAVCALERVKHPISVARMVMERTPHVYLVGEGAQQFAVSQGVLLEPQVLSPHAKKAYEEWLKTSEYKPKINSEVHDTIGMIVQDKNGDFAGACTTSGLSYKMRGRVGDSPIIGAGLFVDNEIGAATATGLGEAVIRICGSFLIVELMRQGYPPDKACQEAVGRIKRNYKNYKDIQIGFIAARKDGVIGGYALQPGFSYALNFGGKTELVKCPSLLK